MPVENRWKQVAEIGLGLASVYFLWKTLFSAEVKETGNKGVFITWDNIDEIPMHPSEYRLATYLLEFEYLRIRHEPKEIQISPEEQARADLRKPCVKPDFFLIDTRTNKSIYIEVTYGDTTTHKKQQQDAVMWVARVNGNKLPYTQIDGAGLRAFRRASCKKTRSKVLEQLTRGHIPARVDRWLN